MTLGYFARKYDITRDQASELIRKIGGDRRLNKAAAKLFRCRSDGAMMTPSSACTGCGRERNLIAVERLANRAYVLRTFRCPSCRSVLRLVGPR